MTGVVDNGVDEEGGPVVLERVASPTTHGEEGDTCSDVCVSVGGKEGCSRAGSAGATPSACVCVGAGQGDAAPRGRDVFSTSGVHESCRVRFTPNINRSGTRTSLAFSVVAVSDAAVIPPAPPVAAEEAAAKVSATALR